MRSMACVVSLLTCLLLGAGAAAQSVINLQGGAGQTVTFTGMGTGTSSLGVTLGNCGFGGGCFLYGLGEGSGDLGSAGIFLVNSAPGSIQAAASGSDAFSLQSSTPVEFPYYGIETAAGQMGLLLDGELNLTNFNLAGSNPSGTTADVGGYLTVSGGSLAAAAGSSLGLTLGVDLPCWTSLTSLVGTGNSLSAALAGGTLAEISPAPEPAGWILAALGALVLGGGYIRRRPRLGTLA